LTHNQRPNTLDWALVSLEQSDVDPINVFLSNAFGEELIDYAPPRIAQDVPDSKASILIANQRTGGSRASSVASFSAFDIDGSMHFQRMWTIRLDHIPSKSCVLFKSSPNDADRQQ
jgi:hypothetical protein